MKLRQMLRARRGMLVNPKDANHWRISVSLSMFWYFGCLSFAFRSTVKTRRSILAVVAALSACEASGISIAAVEGYYEPMDALKGKDYGKPRMR